MSSFPRSSFFEKYLKYMLDFIHAILIKKTVIHYHKLQTGIVLRGWILKSISFIDGESSIMFTKISQ